MAHRLVTSLMMSRDSMTSRDYDIIHVTSQYSKSSYSKTRRIQINYPCAPFKHALKYITLKQERIRITTAIEEAFCNSTPTEIRHFFLTKARRSETKATIDYLVEPLSTHYHKTLC